jgi:MerR family transcriptional regulator, copper efflux regulator
MKQLTIGGLAQQAGVTLEAIRFYERRGLVPPPPRSKSGYRVYPPETAKRLRFIKRAQELGFSLKEIKELLALRVSPTAKGSEVLKRTAAKIQDIEAKIRTLAAMKDALANLADRCPGGCSASKCPILDAFEDEK